MEAVENLRELVNRMPKGGSSAFHVERHDPSFMLDPTERPGYVWPDLSRRGDIQASSIVLVAAPGAMGKTIAAHAIAGDRNAPLIDLSKLPVGNATLTGLLTRVLGWSQAPQFVAKLQAGEATLVLDGVDEAQLAAGRDHFIAFIDNIVELLSAATPALQLVMLGRHDAMDITAAALALRELVPVEMTLTPLTKSQAEMLVDATLDTFTENGRPYSVHRTHPQPFARLRDAVFTDIAIALGVQSGEAPEQFWPEVADFLGYPPVLLVLSRRLAVDNPAADMESLRFTVGPSVTRARGDLLLQIVEAILDREADKVRTLLCTPLKIALEDPRLQLLYTREEQALRVLEQVTGIGVSVYVPASLTPIERPIYESLLSSFVPDHPFVAGQAFATVVFADYVRAFVSTAPLGQMAGRTRDEILAACPPVGPFFAHFVHAVTQDGSLGRIPESLIGDTVHSHYIGPALNPGMILTYNEGKATLLLTEEPGDVQSLTLIYNLTDVSGVAVVPGPLSRAVIAGDLGIVFAPVGEQLHLGPGVVVAVAEIEISAREVTIAGNATGEAAVLMTAGRVEHDPRIRVNAHPPEMLSVYWPEMWHQWKPYRLDGGLPADNIPVHTWWQVALGLRRIMLAFHSSVADEPSVYVEKLDRFGVGANRVFRATLEGLIALQIVRREGSLYRLKLDALGRYGVSYASINGADFVTKLTPLSRAICTTPGMASVLKG
jgi:hypothetical protein